MRGRLLLALSLASAGCVAATKAGPAPDPKSLSSYPAPRASLSERAGPIPPWLLQAWRSADGAPEYADHPLTPEERGQFNGALAALPPAVLSAMHERLIGVYFVEHLRGNGITDWVLDKDGRVYVYMILSPEAFRHSLSETLTLRDRSVFKSPVDVRVDVGPGETGILYSLLHESTHAFDYVRGLTPYTDPESPHPGPRPDGVLAGAWAGYDQAAPGAEFEGRRRLRFYGLRPPELEASEANALYRGLAASPFVSLYGSRSWAEDAAELEVFRFLESLGRPYRIVLGPAGNETVLEPLKSPRVRARLEAVLKPLDARP